MLNLPAAIELFACTAPVDMRMSFDGLAATVESRLAKEPMDGHVYCFFSRNGRHLRLLWWDRDGFLMVCKRLERGRFQLPWALDKANGSAAPACWTIDACDFAAILHGVDLRSVKKLPRWRATP